MAPFSPIAIVGRACVLPGALSPEQLWHLVVEGRSAISSAPAGRWRVDRGSILCNPEDPGAVDDGAHDRAWSDRGGYVEGFEEIFDASGFAVSADRLAGLDPLFLWTLHTAREALRDSGAERGAGARTAAIFGNLSFPSSTMNRLAEAVWFDQAERPDPFNRFTSSGPAALLEQALGLEGGAFCLDAACASSLVAIKLACDQLQDLTADRVLAGAVNRTDPLFIHIGFSALKAMSKTGQSRPFHAQADGLVPGEGAGFVVLKRLADAERDGNVIHGVIRGIGLSNDGRGRGLLAPSDEGQTRALRGAYQAAGIEPRQVSLLECHATGTPAGDGVEVRSSAAVFEGAGRVPIGSLKSNLGHLVTTAGVAGLIKVLEALRHGIRPPTLGCQEPLEALSGAPFRLLTEAEPWDCEGPRIAGVSAFGFGGNNAHLIVSEYVPGLVAEASSQPTVLSSGNSEPIAVVGIGMTVGSAAGRERVRETLVNQQSLVAGGEVRTETVPIALLGLRFPPQDLRHSLAQQTLLLEAAREAAADAGLVFGDNTGVVIGIEADPEIGRYGARWRMEQRARQIGADGDWTTRARDAVASGLEAAGVVGTMPNIPANRLNSQLDAGGFGFTVSAGEDSGLVAMEIAARALRHGELDAAIVGAVDLSCEPVHQFAAAGVLPEDRSVPGDAAIVLVLQRLGDARREHRHVYATLVDGEAPAGAARLGLDDFGQFLGKRLGHPFAASGLLHAAAGVLGLDRLSVEPDQSWVEIGGAKGFGRRRKLVFRADAGGSSGLPADRTTPENGMPSESVKGAQIELPAHPPPFQLPALELPRPVPTEATEIPTAPSLLSVASSEALTQELCQTPRPPTGNGAIAAPANAASSPLERPASRRSNTTSGESSMAISMLLISTYRQEAAQLALAHQEFVQLQTELHEQFLAMRQNSLGDLLASAGTGRQAVAAPAATAALGTTERAPREAPVALVALPTPSGPSFDREQLEIHASARISDLFGPLFAPQDSFLRQVRMPKPPLLLADRVTGIEGEPGSMGLGTIWTETDVDWDSWYLHQGTMPAGIMIEAGQADLMLISWLGVDLVNRGERVYRLLGCELTFHGDLPRPGETLRYDIHLDGHAKQGDVRLMFFHYQCVIDGRPRLTVRGGQAGFFTDEELASSAGVLWSPEDQEIVASPQLASPVVDNVGGELSRAQLEQLALGRPWACFGPSFESAQSHVCTPRIQADPLLLLDRVTELDAAGGPWQRGYLRAETAVAPDDWFFAGHFKNDPCMAGTLMFEGCLQAMSIYLTALGFTLERDGWRFQPVPDQPFLLRCRGQVLPSSKELTYEVFVEEVIGAPVPTLYADLLCTVDGLKAFHARRVGLELVPDYPLNSRPEAIQAAADSGVDTRAVATSPEGFAFDYRSLVACAWGRPSEAFGPFYQRFDGPRRVARLPGPPYHFMSRISCVEGEMGGMQSDSVVEAEYDIPGDAWYFAENGARTMPYAVLLEAGLQPCGWLASYVGSTLTSEHDLAFRNLDGTSEVTSELTVAEGAEIGTLRTVAKLVSISRTAGLIVESFEVESYLGELLVHRMSTVFGFFPAAAMADQVGLDTSDQQRAQLLEPSNLEVELEQRQSSWFAAGRPRLATAGLLMLDRVTGLWPEGGKHGKGRIRAEKDVDRSEWFFKAHFFTDPVQPGSLGLEAMIQLLQCFMLATELDQGIEAPRFEPLALACPLTWKYRGQVLPNNGLISITMDIVDTGSDENGAWASAEASLWVDGKRIYQAISVAMRIVSSVRPHRIVLDPDRDKWIGDHRPTYTLPALPMMSMVDLLASATSGAQPARGPSSEVIGLRDVRVKSWLLVDRQRTLSTEVDEDLVRLWADDLESRTEVASAKVLRGAFPPRPQALEPLSGEQASSPYESGALFHGPAFRVLQSLVLTDQGSTAFLRAASGVPVGLLNPGLLDGATHGIPHDRLDRWGEHYDGQKVAYPAWIPEMNLYGPTPVEGELRCEVRPDGFVGSADFPAFRVQLIEPQGVWASFRLVEACFPKGPIGLAEPLQRRAFLSGERFVPGLALSRRSGGETRLSEAEVAASDWFPGTVEGIYTSRDVERIAVLEHLAAAHEIHPGRLSAALPLTLLAPAIRRDGDDVVVTGGTLDSLDLSSIKEFWVSWGTGSPGPVEDLYYGLIERFVRRVVLESPADFATLEGQSVLYLANHQVGIESLLFSIIAAGLSRVPTLTLAKIEHKESWLGLLIDLCTRYPGVSYPQLITLFDRRDMRSLPEIVHRLGAMLRARDRSLMVHVEGTRSLSCRQPVKNIAGVLIEMAIEVGLPIVPVRLVGGLPAEPLEQRLEFPLGMAKQDLYLGRSLRPEALAGMSLLEQKEAVAGAINSLGPSNEIEQPHPEDPGFSESVLKKMEAFGASPAHSTLLATLAALEQPSAPVRRLLTVSHPSEILGDTPEDKWLRELAARLLES